VPFLDNEILQEVPVIGVSQKMSRFSNDKKRAIFIHNIVRD